MRKTVAGIGRTLITLGLLILLFVGYQLWGTDVFTARAQSKLKHQLSALTQAVNATTTTTAAPSTSPTTARGATTTTTTAPAIQLPPIREGDPLGKIIIPRAGVNWVFVQGTARDDLAKGPGHYPSTPLPGQVGNAAIAGHRTTHGAPFYNINELIPRSPGQTGDYIEADTLIGQFVFEVIDVRTVDPSATWVAGPVTLSDQQLNHTGLKLDPKKAYLTLTSCTPRFSARQRIVVLAVLVGPRYKAKGAPKSHAPVKAVKFKGQPKAESAHALQEGLSGNISSRAPTLLWGFIAAFVGAAWWWAFRRYRLLGTWIIGVVPFLAVLFVFYVYLERLLPANF